MSENNQTNSAENADKLGHRDGTNNNGGCQHRIGRVTRNPFLNFLRDMRKNVQGMSCKQLSLKAAEIWRNMSKIQKEPYRQMARKAAPIPRRRRSKLRRRRRSRKRSSRRSRTRSLSSESEDCEEARNRIRRSKSKKRRAKSRRRRRFK